MCDLIFSTLFVRNSSHSENVCTRCDKIFIGLRVRYPLFFSDFNETWFSWWVLEKYWKFMKIRPVGAELFHAGERTNRHYKANNRFSQFCVAPNNNLHAKFIFCLLDFNIVPSDGWTLNVRRNIMPPSSGFTPMAAYSCNLEYCIVNLYLFVYLVSIVVIWYT